MLDQELRTNEMVVSPVTAIEPVPQRPVITLPVPVAAQSATTPASSRRAHILAALAIPALVALAVAPAVWHQRMSSSRPPAQTVVRTEPAAVSPAAPAAPRTPARVPDRLVPPPAGPATAEHPALSTEAEPTVGLTTTNAVAYSPTFSSVGTAMFYHADAGGRSALMRADTDSEGAVLRITSIVNDTARNFHARPSPDGSLIAFDSDREGERAVYVADANGQRVRRVTGEGFAAVPSWAPDGRSLAFVKAEPNRPQVWNLWTIDLETRDSRRLTNHPFGQPWGGSWFPDGKRIAYSHEDRLILLDLDTGTEKIYPSPRKGRLVRTPSVSPDGRRVMFQVRHDGAWLLELKDGSMRRVLADPSAEEYTWSPDGRRVAYHSRRTGSWGVWVMAPR
jgi:Tol biopolymer transport system component